jgi:hypothetical protein
MKAETLSALTRLNMLEGETLPDRACELLEAGLDPPPALRQLAGLVRPTLREAEPVLRRALGELGVAAPRADDVLLVALDVAERILRGAIRPEHGAHGIGPVSASGRRRCSWSCWSH